GQEDVHDGSSGAVDDPRRAREAARCPDRHLVRMALSRGGAVGIPDRPPCPLPPFGGGGLDRGSGRLCSGAV
ncbi:MAG: hypothetical protein AVDCRST_MAG75-2998, partial [uncultured Propionibacteriaceae bacterium]